MGQIDEYYGTQSAAEASMSDWQRRLLNQFYTTGSSVGNMIIPSLLNFVPVVGPTLSSVAFGLSIAGNSMVEAKQQGMNNGLGNQTQNSPMV